MSHERTSDAEEVVIGSERSFGIVFAVVFAIIGLFPLIHGGAVRPWALAVGAVFLGAAYLAPGILAPLNRVWFRFGLFLHKIVNPLTLGILFFLVITPTAYVARLFGAKFLALGLDPQAETYWQTRSQPMADPDSYKNQF